MPETIVLDPSEVSTGRTQLDISAYVRAEGADWGDGAIEAYMADRERGSAPVDFRIPNRQIVLPLTLRAQGATSFGSIRRSFQAKAGLLQREGGWIKRTTGTGQTVFADIVNASLHLGGSWMQSRAFSATDIEAELRLEAIPDWYGAEEVLPDHIETTQNELIWTETGIKGDYPGRIRLVVDNDSTSSQMGLIWGVRCRHYSNSTTAQLRYEAETCTPLDAATIVGGAVRHTAISTDWTSILSTNQTGGVALTHTGTYRVWARGAVGFTVGQVGNIQWRLLWDVGDFALPTENAPVSAANEAAGYLWDLGEVRLDRVPSGTHRWQGVIQARGPQGNETVQLDKIWLVPVDEGYGVLRAPLSLDKGLANYTARDEFNQTAGVLTGKALPAGGTWAGAGDPADFTVNATTRAAQRQATGSATPRFALAGTTVLSNVVVSAAIQHSVAGGNTGILARYVDTSNYVVMRLLSLASQSTPTIVQVVPVIAGIEQPALLDKVLYRPMVNVSLVAKLAIDAAGRWLAYVGPDGALELVGSGQTSTLATGGTLDDGRVGLWDRYTPTTPNTRVFDNFAAWVPDTDAVLHANQSAELRTEGMFREEATGTAFGPVSYVVGDLPRIPPSGVEGRTVQFIVKASRGDFSTLPDSAADDISARITYRPSYLHIA